MFGRAVSLLLFAAFPSFLFAQTADLISTVEAPANADPGAVFTIRGTVTNQGPDAATNVRVSLSDSRHACQDTIAVLNAGESRTYSCDTMMDVSSGYYVMAVFLSAEGDQRDPDTGNNWASAFIRAVTPPDLWLNANQNGVATPGLPVDLIIFYGNRALTPATGVTLTIVTASRFLSVPDFCTVEGNRAVCNVGSLAAFEPNPSPPAPGRITLTVAASEDSAGILPVVLTIAGAEAEQQPADNQVTLDVKNYRTFFVTSIEDSGTGSLRAAFDGVNAECTDTIPCLVAFRIPPAGQAWHTIGLLTALPPLRHPVTIDGTTQSRYFADTNPAGPEIELSGVRLREGNGIVTSCATQVRALTINGFPENGILTLPGDAVGCGSSYAARLIVDNYIGTDSTGLHAIPNQVGIGVNAAGFSITGNIISGNRRSGIFAGSGMVSVSKNRIGLDAALQPLGNGASGVFISRQSSGSDVSNNYIGFNRHFGVAIARDASYVSAASNSIQANGQGGIDWGLDGAVTSDPVPIPEITSVRVEDGQTIIEGTTTAAGTFEPGITLYANDEADPSGYGEGQYVLGEVRAGHQFRFVSPTDLRGKWITATATRHQYFGWLRNPGVGSNGDTGWYYYTTTSEFSRAVKVE